MSQMHIPPHTKLPACPELFNELSHQLEQFKSQSARSDKQFDTSNEIDYYVISTKFLREWQAMAEKVLAGAGHSAAGELVQTPGLINVELVEQTLVDFQEYVLKRDIQEGVDFKLYNYSVMNIFSRYEGAKIPRRAYYNGHEKKVQLYPIKFNFVYMSQNWLTLLKGDSSLELPVLTSLGYKNQTILDLIYRLVEYSKRDPRNKDQAYRNNAAARIYFSADFDPKEHTKKLRSSEGYDPIRFEAPGSEINTSKIIGDLEIPNEKYMLIVQLQEENWVYKVTMSMDEKQRCEFCRQLKKLKVECACKEVKYCSDECKEKDWKYHVRTCETQLEDDKVEPEFKLKDNSKDGLVGLSNLGNTCYMNAALQCMIHTRDLTEYFSSKKYLFEINETNPIGSKGKLIKSYAKFIDSVLTTEQDVVIPSRLKYTIGKTKEMFQGFEQHDSQEFLLFMLDTLHEDLNRVINKPYTSGVENQGRPDKIVAKESWITYLKRNQSYINDLMGGQYRSEVKCPDCGNISVTFDPYLIFAVPIPSNQKAKSINLYYFYSNYHTDTLKITLSSKNNVVRQLREDLATKTKTQESQILFFVSGFNGSVRKVDDNETVDKLINEKQLNQNSEEKQLFAMQFQKEELEGDKKFLIFKFLIKNSKTLTFKRPFPMGKNLKGDDLYTRICDFTLDLWTKIKAQGKQRVMKIDVLKTKAQQEKLFRIFMSFGKPTQIRNKLTYEHRVEIQPDTNVTELLQKCNYEAEFEVDYAEDPYYSFNSYKSYSADDKAVGHYDYGEGPKVGSDENYTLEECFNEMKKAETLVEGNQVFCSKCQDLKLAEKKMELYKASKYLVLQLRRFKQVGYQKCKNYAQIKFPHILDLSTHIISPGSPQNYFMDDQQFFIKPKYWPGYDKSEETKYRLYGIVNHHGGLNSGHYTAFATHKDKWYKFDDKEVSEVDPEKVVSSAAYLLFYERL